MSSSVCSFQVDPRRSKSEGQSRIRPPSPESLRLISFVEYFILCKIQNSSKFGNHFVISRQPYMLSRFSWRPRFTEINPNVPYSSAILRTLSMTIGSAGKFVFLSNSVLLNRSHSWSSHKDPSADRQKPILLYCSFLF